MENNRPRLRSLRESPQSIVEEQDHYEEVCGVEHSVTVCVLFAATIFFRATIPYA